MPPGRQGVQIYRGDLQIPFQRGKEHQQEVSDAKKTHPLVLHFQESHDGQEQELLMRTVKQARTALERQVWESVTIDRLTHRMEEARLNLKISGATARIQLCCAKQGSQTNP